MRIVTRPDFDGVVCAALLKSVLSIKSPILWVQPSDMQKGRVTIEKNDIIANLPYHENCAMWFDHHYTNLAGKPFDGLYRIAPSAAGLVYEYYSAKISNDYHELVRQTDRIDSAELTGDEVRRPEQYPYVLLSMTISGKNTEDTSYWNRLVDLLATSGMDHIMKDPEIALRCRRVIKQNRDYETLLKDHVRIEGAVAVADFRDFETPPTGNRFLVYALYPETVVSVKIRYEDNKRRHIRLSAGHSIFNRNCRVNLGLLLSDFEGGGHRGAAACSFKKENADGYISKILAVLVKNEPNEGNNRP